MTNFSTTDKRKKFNDDFEFIKIASKLIDNNIPSHIIFDILKKEYNYNTEDASVRDVLDDLISAKSIQAAQSTVKSETKVQKQAKRKGTGRAKKAKSVSGEQNGLTDGETA